MSLFRPGGITSHFLSLKHEIFLNNFENEEKIYLQNFKLPKNVKIAQKRKKCKNVFFKHQFKKYIIIM